MVVISQRRKSVSPGTRMRVLFSIICVLCGTGTVYAQGSTIDVSIRDASGRAVSHAVVLAHAADAAGTSADAAAPRAVIRQQFQQFDPGVMAVRVGTTIEFPNFDRMRHHVYSFSEARRFEIRLYSGEEVPSVTFENPGIVVIGCNIHDWMEAWIYVTDAPFFAVADASGNAVLQDLDASAYALSVWHPGLNEPVQIDGVAGVGSPRISIELAHDFEPPSQERPQNDLLARFELADQ